MDRDLIQAIVKDTLIGGAIGIATMICADKVGLSLPMSLCLFMVVEVGYGYVLTKKREKEQGAAIEDFISKEVERRSKESCLTERLD